MKVKNWQLVFVSILLASVSCNSEYRLYQRVGGDHLHLKSGNKELFWFNGIHGNDPKNKMFNEINEELRKFSPDAVLVEGHANRYTHKDELSAIRSGESEYVSFLAREDNIACFDIEPSDSLVNRYLIEKYGKKDVLTMYLIRQMVQWNRSKKNKTDFEQQVIEYLTWEDSHIGYFGRKITMESVTELLKPHTDFESINNDNWYDFDAKKYIYFSSNRISIIYNDISNFRNEYLLSIIRQKKSEYDKVFIMMGFDHAKEVEKEIIEIYQ